jgi:hypothetical protein
MALPTITTYEEWETARTALLVQEEDWEQPEGRREPARGQAQLPELVSRG